MAVDSLVKTLREEVDTYASTSEILAHARKAADESKLDEYFVVDIDSHREPNACWPEVIEYIENPVMRANSEHDLNLLGTMLYVPGLAGPGIGHSFQALHGRIPHHEAANETLGDISVYRDVELCRRTMDAMSIDVQIVFPTSLLALGMTRIPGAEGEIAWAYNRWMVERFCAEDPRLKFMPYLPLNEPDYALRIVREFAGRPEVVGFLVTSVRYCPVYDNQFMQLYAEIEESGLPLAFHAGPTWEDEWMKSMNRFLSVHALSFVHCNMVHLTNWVINGIPERFPKLKVIWVESGIAWVPYLMARLDSEYLKRSSEAPLLTRLPSEYMKDMWYSSQPLEMDHADLLESNMKAINAETQLLYASDWPHWDFDLPAAILSFPFLSEEAKRNILGLNAAKVFNLDVPPHMGPRPRVTTAAPV
jgi:uncharacterized protein